MKPFLLGIAVLLGGLLAWQWHDWPPPAPVAGQGAGAPATAAPAGGAPAPAGLPPPTPKDDYASVRNRPLFLPERRPPEPEPEVVEAPPPEEASDLSGMKLTAVVIAPQIVKAWVQSPTSPELLPLRIGDELEGWSVTGIEPDKLVLERQGTRDELKLRDFENADASAPPPPPPGGVTRQRDAASPPAPPGGVTRQRDVVPPPAARPPSARAGAPQATRQPGRPGAAPPPPARVPAKPAPPR